MSISLFRREATPQPVASTDRLACCTSTDDVLDQLGSMGDVDVHRTTWLGDLGWWASFETRDKRAGTEMTIKTSYRHPNARSAIMELQKRVLGAMK